MSALIALLLPLAALALELYLHHSGRLNGKPLLWSLPVWWLLPFVAGAAWWVYDTDAGTGFFAAYLFARAWFLFYAFYLNDITARFNPPTALQKRLLNCALMLLSLLPVLLAGILAGVNALAAPLLPLLLALAAAYTAWRLLGKDAQPHIIMPMPCSTLVRHLAPAQRTTFLVVAQSIAPRPTRLPRCCPTRCQAPLIEEKRTCCHFTCHVFGSGGVDWCGVDVASPACGMGIGR